MKLSSLAGRVNMELTSRGVESGGGKGGEGKKIGSSEVETMLTDNMVPQGLAEKVWLPMSEWKDKHLWKDQYMS